MIKIPNPGINRYSSGIIPSIRTNAEYNTYPKTTKGKRYRSPAIKNLNKRLFFMIVELVFLNQSYVKFVLEQRAIY